MPKRTGEPQVIENPLVIIFRDASGGNVFHIYPPQEFDHRHYGILICDLVRHVARMMNVPEEDIWEWVDKERNRPTAPITTAS